MLKAKAQYFIFCQCVCGVRLVLRGLQMTGMLKKRSKGNGEV